MKDKLKDILADMSIERDEEEGHINADVSLIRTIRILSEASDPETKAVVSSIISTFRDLPKWYA